MSQRRSEIRIQFRHVPGNLFTEKFGKAMNRKTNELVIRIQPEESIYMKVGGWGGTGQDRGGVRGLAGELLPPVRCKAPNGMMLSACGVADLRTSA